jgi:hypothetical protein
VDALHAGGSNVWINCHPVNGCGLPGGGSADSCPPPVSICPILHDTVGGGDICVDGGATFREVNVSGGTRANDAANTIGNDAKSCNSLCCDAGLACIKGWDDLRSSMGGNGCDHWTSHNTDPTAADDHCDRLIDMAVHGCLSNMGGQVYRCGVASACGVMADFLF